MKWSGSTVVVMASGPSLRLEDCGAVWQWRDNEPAKRHAIAINTTFRAAPWADVIYGCDYQWWKVYIAEVTFSSKAELWTQDALAARSYGLHHIESQVGSGLMKGKPYIPQGGNGVGNGGHQAVALAALWGAERIVLLGFDMQTIKGKSHWHGDHPDGLKKIPPFGPWIAGFGKLAEDLTARGIETINASRETALQCFPRQTLTEALASKQFA